MFPRCRRNKRCLSTTYYDSQSGLHIPVHNETEIRLYLDVTDGYGDDDSKRKAPFVPQKLNKDRVEADEVSEKLQELVQQGIHGVILPTIKFPRDIRNLQTLSVIAPPNFVFLLNKTRDETNNESNNVDDGLLNAKDHASSTIFSKVLRYRNEDGFRESLKRSVERGLHTTLSVTKDRYYTEPITLANNIAAMIDANGGCDYIWLSSGEESNEEATALADTMVEVCEELAYLDVAGATIKSRLIVDSVNEDMLEDIMFAGINKFVVDHENKTEMVESVASEQGKILLRSQQRQ